MKLDKKNKKILNRIRFGNKKNNILPVVIILFIFYLFTIGGVGSALKNNDTLEKLIAPFLIIFLSKIIILTLLINVISIKKYKSFKKIIIYPLISSEIILIFFEPSLNFLMNARYNVPIPDLATWAIILLMLISYYVTKSNVLKKETNGKNYFSYYMSIIFLSFLFAFIMSGFISQKKLEITTVLIIRDILVALLIIWFILDYMNKTKNMFEMAIDLKKQNACHGDIVYFKGKNSLITEINEEKKIFNFSFTEKIYLYQIKNGNRHFDTYYEEPKFFDSIGPMDVLYLGCDFEILGKYIILKKENEPNRVMIIPYFINILETNSPKQNKK
nr:hypothetical protein [Nanoarchaeum sp.]